MTEQPSATATDPQFRPDAEPDADEGHGEQAQAPTAFRPLAAMARVDLLPLEIVDGRRFYRARRVVIGLVAASLVIGLGAAVDAELGVLDARSRLSDAETNRDQVQATQQRYAAVPKLTAQLEAARAARAEALRQDVLWYRYLDDLQGTLPRGVKLTLVNAVLPSASVAAGGQSGTGSTGSTGSTDGATGATGATGASGAVGAGDSLTPTGIGTLQLCGTAGSYAQVSTWLTSLETITGLTGVRLGAVTKGADTGDEPPVTFNASAVITAEALSNRFTKGTG